MTETGAEIVLNKLKTKGLMISRVPEPTRTEFIEFAEAEFAGDYGMTIKQLMYCRELFSFVLGNFDLKLDKIIHILESKDSGEKNPEKKVREIKFLSGRKVNIEQEEK